MADEEKLMELFFDHDIDVENIEVENDVAIVTAPPDVYSAMVKCLEDNQITPEEISVVPVPDNLTPVNDEKTAAQLLALIEALEDYDDVQEVYNNADIPDEIAEKLED
ncbi:MAG: hypothetical protein D6820_15510 [Lentisphaerae bacterium]|nr:MAG: hypothetical protein D6820_15510 [Lentisphaerota bacterium]